MRVAYLGNDPWSVPPLQALAASARQRPVLVVTRTPRPAGRGGIPRPTAVSAEASSLDLTLAEVATVKEGEGLERLRGAGLDALVVVAYGEILPPKVLDLPRVAPVNLHFSVLPALRGADPVRRAILAGLDATGVTTIRMDRGLDTGPILLQADEPIGAEDDAGTLGHRLAERGGRLLVDTLDGLEAGALDERPQDHTRATSAPKLGPEEEEIDWAEPAEAVWRRVRALSPEPGARTTFRGRVLKILRVAPVQAGGEPGGIIRTGGSLVVACGSGAVALEEVLPEGRRRMAGADFARGRRPEPGERLGRADHSVRRRDGH